LECAVKGQCADFSLCLYLPLIAVFCRSRDAVRALQSGLPDSQQLRADSGKSDGQESVMGEPFAGTAPSVGPPEDRLDSWKEIAAYLNRDVTTVQRWEKR
jgi:hypothetical protein